MSDVLRAAVWAKAKDGPFGTKIDDYGNPMIWSDYGKADSRFGWEIDHFPLPKAAGGPDDLWNLRALNCRQNRSNGGLLGNALRNVFAQPSPARGLFGSSYRRR